MARLSWIDEDAIDRLARSHDIADRGALASAIDRAIDEYLDAVSLGWPELPDELDAVAQIGDELDHLLHLFHSAVWRREHHFQRLAEALEGDDLRERGGWLWDFLCHLNDDVRPGVQRIRDAAATANVKRGRGKPPLPKNLYRAVTALIEYWVDELGRPFTNLWHESGDPISPTARFGQDAMRLIARHRVRELPTVMKRLHATFGKEARDSSPV